ncbi:hypothetical protein JJD41_20320 [Oxynema sp. CENA135]|uniref:hypothetical protein n=1 Tax=Oxynema sp. CENA135 TaxID=984206 RepID=UPI00190C77C2|nr:hypothetical protein [Oxynema sp. CENA135]MBK4732193.1 hypothetical protein [Oxynema sp. CENA135]
MKDWNFSKLFGILPISLVLLFGLIYYLATFHIRLALVTEFALLSSLILIWFKLFDRLLTHP